MDTKTVCNTNQQLYMHYAFGMSTKKYILRPRGVALVAVLSVLTVLALLAMTLAIHTGMQQKSSEMTMYTTEARNIAEAGLEHAKALLWCDTALQNSPADSYNDLWRTAFDGSLKRTDPTIDVDLVPFNGPKRNGKDSIWYLVHDDDGNLVGRYAVIVQDECSKINLNAACMVPPLKPHEGLNPREIFLIGEDSVGLPMTRKNVLNFLKVRYGPNRVPGARGDDNQNNNYYMADRLDNNANGIIDEMNEGIDEWDEYVPFHPFGDDRSFFNIVEAYLAFSPDAEITRRKLNILREYASFYSQDYNIRRDTDKNTWVAREPLNATTVRETYKTLRDANSSYRFEPDSRMLRRLAANTVDYRDENNVLSTIADEYGVEAVCFNEVLANEGSKLKQTYYIQSYREDDVRVHNLAYYFSNPNYKDIEPLADADPEHREEYFSQGSYYGAVARYVLTNDVKRAGGGLKVPLSDNPIYWKGYYDGFKTFKDLLSRRNSKYINGDDLQWPKNIFKNGYLCVYEKATADELPAKAFKITASDDDSVTITGASAEDYKKFKGFSNPFYKYAQIRTWVHEKADYAEHPKVSNWYLFSGLEPNAYYRLYLQETNLNTPDEDDKFGRKHADVIDADGELNAFSEERIHRLRYPYKNAEPVRADRKGCVDVFVTSSANCSPQNRNRLNAVYFARPDIIELINISDKPISLRNWSLVANTGSLAYDLGKISHAISYSREDHRNISDPNPVIRPHEYFYLCNNAEIFDYDYGSSKNGTWGNEAGEQMPVYEIPDDTWGVRFEITDIRETYGSKGWTTYVTCGNENWQPDQFRGEVAEFQTDRNMPEGESPDGVRAIIGDDKEGNTRNALIFRNLKLKDYSGVRVGDYVMIVGLPRIGGFVSMTLKNEYDQIAARMLKYGEPREESSREPERWEGWSAEKSDPTKEEWVLTENPSFGGLKRIARNSATRTLAESLVPVKNGLYASVGEMDKVRRITTASRKNSDNSSSQAKRLVQGAAEFFCTSGVRLDPEEPGAHIRGWLPAFGEASFADTRGVTDHNAQWEPNIWAGQWLRILSGRMCGETYAVEANGQNRISIVGKSVPSRKDFFIGAGDAFALGPGYSSASYYSRTPQEVGEWEWTNKRIPEGKYALYLAGLNDSINTEEFLEENHNAILTLYLWNYRTRSYEEINDKIQYSKDDMAFAGYVEPRHMSHAGGIRIKLVPRGLNNPESSGFAWFDYAYVAPVPVFGRININTAPPRVLCSLKNINASLAKNIYYGKDEFNKNTLKPYQSISDILKVKGITPDIFSAIANLITIRSDQYNTLVIGERILDANHDGKYNEENGDEIVSTARIRAMLDRTPLLKEKGVSSAESDEFTGQPVIKLVEKELM